MPAKPWADANKSSHLRWGRRSAPAVRQTLAIHSQGVRAFPPICWKCANGWGTGYFCCGFTVVVVVVENTRASPLLTVRPGRWKSWMVTLAYVRPTRSYWVNVTGEPGQRKRDLPLRSSM
jgi:hypothetical protein